MTVADLANTGLDEKAVIDHAIKRLSQGGTVRVNVPARIYQVYGRQLTVEGADGSRSMVAIFDIMGWLYQIEAKVLPGGNEFELTRSSNRWYSSAASRTARWSKSAPFANLVAAWPVLSMPRAIPLTQRAWTIHAAKSGDESVWRASALGSPERRANPADQPHAVITIHDPKYYTRDWQARFVYTLRDDVWLEDYVCGEPHRDLSSVAGMRRP